MRVLSLFDGIACGRVALERAGVIVDDYYSYEIDKNCITVVKDNYSDIISMYDVTRAHYGKYKNFDLLIGGSPCQDLSSMGSYKGLDGPQSILFFEFVKALEVTNMQYFLFENIAAMTKDNINLISDYLGINPILIDSADFSAQQRKRLYWTNIPILPYCDKNLYLRDIITLNENRVNVTNKVNKYLSEEYKGRKIQKTVKASIKSLNEKSNCICTNSGQLGSNSSLVIKIDNEYFLPNINDFEKLQTLPVDYCKSLNYRNAVKAIGNGWTVDVIAHIFKGLRQGV